MTVCTEFGLLRPVVVEMPTMAAHIFEPRLTEDNLVGHPDAARRLSSLTPACLTFEQYRSHHEQQEAQTESERSLPLKGLS